MNQAPHHLRRLTSILKNPSILLSTQSISKWEKQSLPLIEFPKHIKEVTIISQILTIISQMLLSWTHTIPAYENSICNNPKVIGQCRDRWSIISPLPPHRMHQSRQKPLKKLLNCNKSSVFTFFNTINQAKVMTLEGTLSFHKKLVRWKGTESDKLVKAKKKDFN